MPVQTPQWCDLLCCCICYNVFDGINHQPVSLVCGHTACRSCLLKLKSKQCPFDQSAINIPVCDLPQNMPILKILEAQEQVVAAEEDRLAKLFEKNDLQQYRKAAEILDSLASYLRRAQSEKGGSVWSPQLSRPMQRKLVTLLCCQMVEPEGRGRAMKAIRSLGERSLMELLLLHQNPYHLSSNLWAAVRARGCQFLGPAMQEEVLKLVLLALSEGALISRKVLVMYIVQTLEKDYPQASKTSVGHVVQLLYRASCFNVIKRDGESSLMQLKEEFRTYEALRREHDAQIVQIAMEAGLRISPDQWSALLYGDQAHKSHMQSIIDRLQTPQSFVQSIQELLIGLQRTGDPGTLVELRPHYELLADIDATQGENVIPNWNAVVDALVAVKAVVDGQTRFCDRYGGNRNQRESVERSVVAYKLKTSMCRDIGESKTCPRGESCTFAHSLEEMERYRARSRLMGYRSNVIKSRGVPDGSVEGAPSDGNRSDNEFDFSMDDTDICEIAELKTKVPLLQSQSHRHQSPLLQQPPVMVARQTQPPQPTPIPVYPPPSAFQSTADDGTTPGTVIMNTPPPAHFGPGTTTVMMQWPPGATIVNTLNGPIALGSAHPGSLPLGTTVRYQVFRHGGASCPPPSQAMAAPVPVAPAPPEYGYYWYPQAASMQPRAGMYHPDVLHLEVPLAARVVPSHQVAGAGNMTTAGGVTANVPAHYHTTATFPEMPTATNNPVAQTASVTPFGNYAFAQADPGTVYFYPSPPEHHAPQPGTVQAAAGQFGVYITPALDDVLVCPPPPPAAVAGTTNGMMYQMNDGDFQHQYQQQKSMIQNQGSRRTAEFGDSNLRFAPTQNQGSCGQIDMKNVVSTSTSCANTEMVISSSNKILSSCVPPASCSGPGAGIADGRNKEDTEKQSRLHQLEMKKHEIIKCLTSIKKETVPYQRSQQLQRQYRRDDHSDSALPRSSSDSDQADSLSVSIATSVLQEDYPTINYAAAVLRGRQNMAGGNLPLPAMSGINYSNGASESGYWSSASASTVPSPSMVVSSGGGRCMVPPSSAPPISGVSATFAATAGSTFMPKRSTSADGNATIDYSPWKSSATGTIGSAASAGNAWSQTKTLPSNGVSKSAASSAYNYATRPYIPDEYIDIKHLSDDVLRKELEQLPPSTKRLHYVRLELEAREADAWRSEDDQVIPFSNCGPQVSRYGPISRAGQRMQASLMTSNALSAVGAAPSDMVQVKDILHQPLPTAVVQPTKDQPLVSRDDVDPSQIVSSIPQVFKVAASIDPASVDEKLEKLVEVKSKLACIPLEEGPSSAEKEQLKLELELINKEISMLDKHTGEEYLLKALENVNLNIEELQQQQPTA